MRRFVHIAATMWCCAALGLAFVLLAFFNGMAEIRQAEVIKHLQTIVGRVQGPASAWASLGFPVEFNASFQSLIDSLNGAVGQVGGTLCIADSTGRVVFSSDRSIIESEIPHNWQAGNEDTGDTWIKVTPREMVVGATITNGFSARVGTVFAWSSRKNLLLDGLSTIRLPGLISFAFLVFAALVAVLGVAVTVRPLALMFEDMARHYRAMKAVVLSDGATVPAGATSGMEAVAAVGLSLAEIERQGKAADTVSAGDPARFQEVPR
jgi:hypothetical protein